MPCYAMCYVRLIEPLWLTVRLMRWMQHWWKQYLTWLWLSKVWQQKVCRWFNIEKEPGLDVLRRLFAFLLSVNCDAVSNWP